VAAPEFVLRGDGWLDGARNHPSPNFDARPPDSTIDLLVIHNISLPPGEFGGGHIERLFCNSLDPAVHPFFDTIASLRVSSHFVIARDGALTQFVSVRERAWHAGASSFAGRSRCNDFSIGVELEGSDFVAFTDAQYASLAALVVALRRQLPLTALRGHDDIAPGRKTDPGPLFDWPRLARQAGLPPALLPPQAGAQIGPF
jgi:N-acetyl-anhydromuramoyl-L-alanine amidase